MAIIYGILSEDEGIGLTEIKQFKQGHSPCLPEYSMTKCNVWESSMHALTISVGSEDRTNIMNPLQF